MKIERCLIALNPPHHGKVFLTLFFYRLLQTSRSNPQVTIHYVEVKYELLRSNLKRYIFNIGYSILNL